VRTGHGHWLPWPLQYRMTRRVHSSKRREWKVELDAEDFPLCLHLGVKCENPENVRGENVDEVVQLAGIASRRIMQPKRDTMRPSKRWLNWYWFQQTRRMRCRRDCARLPPQPWGRSWIRQIQKIVIGENVDVEQCSQKNKQELVHSAEAVAKRLSK
jgi:hypothetical protein